MHCTCILFLHSLHAFFKKKKPVHSLTCRLLNFHSLTIWGAVRVNYSGNVITEHFLTKATYAIKNNPICKLTNWLSGSHSNTISHRMPECHQSLRRKHRWQNDASQYLPVFGCLKLPVSEQSLLPSGMTTEATWNQATCSSTLEVSHPQVDVKYWEADTIVPQTMGKPRIADSNDQKNTHC